MGKQMKSREKMDFPSKYMASSAFLMGLSLFLRCLYYMGLHTLSDFEGGQLFLFLILPILLCGAYIALTAVAQINIPLIYGSLGALLCLMAMVWCFTTGDVFRIIMGVLFYGGSGALLVCIILGFLRDTRLAVTYLGLAVILRVLIYDLGSLSVGEWCIELSTLSLLGALCLLPLTIVKVNKKKTSGL